jgi:hypothetical protein
MGFLRPEPTQYYPDFVFRHPENTGIQTGKNRSRRLPYLPHLRPHFARVTVIDAI